jgi:hypothetical protein
MKAVPSARIPANKVNAHVQSLGWAFVTLMHAGGEAGEGPLLTV